MSQKPVSPLLSIVYWLARPALLFYALPWLLVLLTFGTVAQRYIGLYHSERIFFGSFIFWLGYIPLPGAYATLTLIALSVLAKLIFKSPLRKRSAGTIITHVSILVLLGGGLVSALSREEGYITFAAGETSQTVSDYHERTLVVLKNKEPVLRIPYAELSEGRVISDGLPFTLRVQSACYPCAPEALEAQNPEGYGMAAAVKLVKTQPSPDDSQNFSGAMLAIEGVKKGQSGPYIAFELVTEPPEIIVDDDRYGITMRPAERPLPFSLKLVEFIQENHPGTELARAYQSDVVVKDGELEWKAGISMNDPLRYRGYTIYQASFVDNGEKRASVLTVVKNAGWVFPYLAIIAVCVGMLVHLFARGKTTAVAIVLACLLMQAGEGHAGELPAFDYGAFAHTPVLHEGRIKSLDSFARALLKNISGKTKLEGYGASAWLAEALFNPSQSMTRPVFLVRSHTLQQALQLQPADGTRYSFTELAPILSAQSEVIKKLLGQNQRMLSDSEKELLRLHDSFNLYAGVLGSLSVLRPVADISPELRKELGLEAEGDISFQSLLRVRHKLMEKLKAIVAAKKNDLPSYTLREQEIANLAYQIDSREELQRSNSILRIVPGQWDSKEEWLSPWGVITGAHGSPETARIFTMLAGLDKAWNEKDAAAWRQSTQGMHDLLMGAHGVRPAMIDLEVNYNGFNPLGKVMAIYTAAVLCALAAVILQRRWLFKGAFILSSLAVAIHAGAITARMLILQRPPVSTLYESMIFVSLISVACGLYISWRRRGSEGMLAGSVVAVVVLYVADIFAGDGDTLEMLTAVLNTNFWLGTHVVCITAGYGFSLIAGVMAHFYLFLRAMAAPWRQLRDQHRLLHTLALIALFFTATGTMLGGIWADQSWGRFWGWDPKENGALAIVIWLIWVLHGRIAGQLRETAFAAMLAFTTVVVALAWVGVNLLSVGLHSYGFSSAAAWGLPIFCLLETVIIAMLAYLSAQQYNVIRYSQKHDAEKV